MWQTSCEVKIAVLFTNLNHVYVVPKTKLDVFVPNPNKMTVVIWRMPPEVKKAVIYQQTFILFINLVYLVP